MAGITITRNVVLSAVVLMEIVSLIIYSVQSRESTNYAALTFAMIFEIVALLATFALYFLMYQVVKEQANNPFAKLTLYFIYTALGATLITALIADTTFMQESESLTIVDVLLHVFAGIGLLAILLLAYRQGKPVTFTFAGRGTRR